ncbi:MAG TPA: WYL domain-containing protein [Luteimonas sp.]
MAGKSSGQSRQGNAGAQAQSAHAEAKDPLLRNVVLLGLIPRQPRSKTVAELQRDLEARGFHVSTRTLQRDLANKLAAEFPIYCDDTTTPYRWSFDRHAQFNLPAVDPAAALALHLSEGHLQRVLPPGVLAALEPQFEEARRQLSSTADAPFGAWARRVRAVPLGPVTKPAAVPLDVWEAIAEALLKGRQLEISYLSRSKGSLREMLLHPQGLASRGAVTYLISCVERYEDLRHFALHRIRAARIRDARVRDCGFDIDAYLQVAAFAPRHGDLPAVLRAHVHPSLAWSLRELPLGEDQCITPGLRNDWMSLTVSVADNEETLRWIRAQGPEIRVLEPRAWKLRLADEAGQLVRSYQDTAENPAVSLMIG